MLNEYGQPLLAEYEAESGGGSELVPVFISAKASLQLASNSNLSKTVQFISVPIKASARLPLESKGNLSNPFQFVPVFIKASAHLQLDAKGRLSKQTALKGKATLHLVVRNGIAQPPSGLGAQMKIISDPIRPEVILDQYLNVWFDGHPHQNRMALKRDDHAEFQPAWTWQNPGVTRPAILRIDSAEIPGDGLTHRMTVAAWQDVAGRTSARTTFSLSIKTPSKRTVEVPAWCGATLIRQSTESLCDLTKLEWRYSGAVKIFAKYRVRNSKFALVSTTEAIGYADYDEDTFYVEDMGLKIVMTIEPVLFGVAAIDKGQFGVITWASQYINIHHRANYTTTEFNPDLATARTLIYSGCKDEIGKAIFAENSWNYPVYLYPETVDTKRRQIIDTAMDKLLIRIKEITRQGGSVTLDNLGTFEARWNEARSVRSVAFVPSVGFKEGTKAGQIMTDAEAKAA
ncbi:MAG: hypothetical protein IPL99_12290 [Candidatus Competibacteraceae bacterium]|nr:hypothetical protein [Candidatus Competibacteraceae bacterium]